MYVPSVAPDPAQLASAWPIGHVHSATPTEPGHNNRSWVIAADRGRHVLRLYDNLGERAIRYEHSLLTFLGSAGLPFAVPVPVEMTDGGTLHVTRGEGAQGAQGAQVLRAALFPFLRGEHLGHTDPAVAALLGEALACLHPALKRAGEVLGPSPITGYGDVRRIHPLVPDPLQVGALLQLDRHAAERLAQVTQRALDSVAQLYATLPTQLIHADYGHFNVLVADGRVSAVLDFEFSCQDVRAMDIAAGVRHFGHEALFAGGDFAGAETFVRGYAAVQRPSDQEIAALPELIRLAAVVIHVHHTGRCLQGFVTRDHMDRAAHQVIDLSEALDARGPELVARLLQSVRAR